MPTQQDDSCDDCGSYLDGDAECSNRSAAEYNFVEDSIYFDRLIPAGRPVLVQELKAWLQPGSHRNVKFLASDFIGKYHIEELQSYLLSQAHPYLDRWSELEDKDRDWVLNYFWAASRCEKHRYASLGKLLCTTRHRDIQEWILFVPLQMPDKEFIPIISDYLRLQSDISKKCIALVVRSLALLEHHGHSTKGIFAKYSTLFSKEEVRKEIEEAWRHNRIDPCKVLDAINKPASLTHV